MVPNLRTGWILVLVNHNEKMQNKGGKSHFMAGSFGVRKSLNSKWSRLVSYTRRTAAQENLGFEKDLEKTVSRKRGR